MLCQKCHKNLATIRYGEVIDGKVTDLNVCPACLSRLTNSAVGFELAGAAPSPKRVTANRVGDDKVASSLVCRECGTKLEQALKENRVGCRACFDAFAEPLDSVLRSMHGALRHRGKAPRVDDLRERMRAQLQNKRALLRSSLKMENYEAAAALRDEIRSLEEELGVRALGQES